MDQSFIHFIRTPLKRVTPPTRGCAKLCPVSPKLNLHLHRRCEGMPTVEEGMQLFVLMSQLMTAEHGQQQNLSLCMIGDTGSEPLVM